MNTLALRAAARAGVRRSQFGMAAALRITGWLAVNALAACGVLALVFFTLGSFTMAGTMLQLDNLASRYVAADAGRQAQFDMLLCTAALIAFAAIGVFRRASLLRIFQDTETTHG